MNNLQEDIVALIATVLGNSGTVTWEPPGRVIISLDGGPTFGLEVAQPPKESHVPEASTPTLWVLRRPKRGELENLRAQDQSFVALNGAVRLQSPGVLIDRNDVKLPTRAVRPSQRSAFSDRASLIPRWLFKEPSDSEWTITRLADCAGVSLSVTSYAVKDLERRHLLDVQARGRERLIRLVDHRQLLVQWAREYDWRDNPSLAVHAPVGSVQRFLRRMASLELPRCALTLQGAASLLTPHAPVEKLHLYVDLKSRASLSSLARRLDWNPDPDGEFQFLLPYYKTSVWRGLRERDGVPLVSDLQLMLDLWNHPIRGREQAELLLEKHIMSFNEA